MVRFRGNEGPILKSFNPDFGSNIIHQFRIAGSLSSNELSNSDNWEIFPNPTKHNIVIEGNSDNKTELSIINNLGKIVFTTNLNNAEFISETIDISHLKNGLYFLQITNSKNRITKKIVKQ
tara:strand:- start:496 stop:858 length:363 start_codon:yes stop_codon:yes gene_type:complete